VCLAPSYGDCCAGSKIERAKRCEATCAVRNNRDVTETFDMTLEALGCDQTRLLHKLRLLSDNAYSYSFIEAADRLSVQQAGHVCDDPCHPQTRDKIKCLCQITKNHALQGNYYQLCDLKRKISIFVETLKITTKVYSEGSTLFMWYDQAFIRLVDLYNG